MNKAKRAAVAAMVMLVGAAAIMAGGKAFAQWGKLSAEGLASLRLAGKSAPAPVPPADEVGVPCYPGAVVVSILEAQGGMPMETINLVSSDPPAKVVAFYKAKLLAMPGWKWSSKFKFFYKGDNEMDAFQMKIPGLTVQEESGESFDLKLMAPSVVKSAKTRIQVIFKPKGK